MFTYEFQNLKAYFLPTNDNASFLIKIKVLKFNYLHKIESKLDPNLLQYLIN